jgi:hypothetical protein
MTGARPAFLVTIDTEGDDLWSRPRRITTRNAEFLPRFQALCERYGLRPTYLVDYDMGRSPAFVAFASDLLRRRAGEVGMHLHAWNTPPLHPRTPDDLRWQPYLTEYPEPVMAAKVATMTALLRERFGEAVVSHRAGRWGLDARYARVLVAHGYLVDCSVTPGVSWRDHLGAPDGTGGPDFSSAPETPYFLSLEDVTRPGPSPLLEVPVSVVRGPGARLARRLPSRWRLIRRVVGRGLPSAHWLRPTGRNRRQMVAIVRRALGRRAPHLTFMLHSSELMPGGSPRFPSRRAVERLYADLEGLFGLVQAVCTPMTLSEFRGLAVSHRAAAGAGAG